MGQPGPGPHLHLVRGAVEYDHANGMRRFTRLTNAFCKKMENHAHAVALLFMYYNFARPHQTLTKAHPNRYPTTPAMAAGIADHVWTLEEVCALLYPARLVG